MIDLTASGLWRAEKCPGSAVLPRVKQLHADAERGTALHAESEAENPEGAEVAMAFNVFTGKGRLLPQAKDRDYGPLAHGEIPGRADRLEVEAGRVVVRDRKTGFGYMVKRAAENPQLALYAVAAADIHNKPEARVSVEIDDRQPDVADLDSFALAEARQRMRRIYDGVATASQDFIPRVVTGDHCWRCECAPFCPAWAMITKAAFEGALPAILDPDPTLIGQTWPLYQAAKKALGLYEQAVRSIVGAYGGVPMGGGKMLTLEASQREDLDADVVRQVVRDMHGEAVADAAMERSTSKARLERALAPIAPPRGKAALVRKTLDAVRLANGVTVKHTGEQFAIVDDTRALPAKTEEAA